MRSNIRWLAYSTTAQVLAALTFGLWQESVYAGLFALALMEFISLEGMTHE